MNDHAVSGIASVRARVFALESRLRTLDDGAWSALGAAATAATGSAGLLGLSPGEGLSPSSFASALASARVATRSIGWSVADSVDADVAFVDPVPGARLTQDFGPTDFALAAPATVDGVRYEHYHDGLDLAASLGTPVRAAASGVVVSAGRQSDGAVVVRLRHADGSETSYGHLAPELPVVAGDRVGAGETIGAVGLTGRTTGPHLHFELIVDGQTIDPAPWLERGRLPGADTTQAEPHGLTATQAAAGALVGAGGALAGATGTPDALLAFDAIAPSIPYAEEIRSAALRAGIDPLLLTSLIRAESGFRRDAVSSAGALGLTQLMPMNVRSMGVEDPFDPAENAAAGARYLANNLRIFGRADLALAAYHAGKGAVRAAGGIPDSPRTQRYVERVLGYWAGYLERSAEAAGVAA